MWPLQLHSRSKNRSILESTQSVVLVSWNTAASALYPYLLTLYRSAQLLAVCDHVQKQTARSIDMSLLSFFIAKDANRSLGRQRM